MKLIYAVYVFFGFINTSLTSCPEGWIADNYTANCFYVSKDQMSFDDARNYCDDNDAHMLTRDLVGEDNDFLKELMEHDEEYWIGEICRSSSGFVCQWIWPWFESSADDDVPSIDPSHHCEVAIRDSDQLSREWESCDSDNVKRFICQTDGCPDGWTPVLGALTCFKEGSASVTYAKATHICNSQGARLMGWNFWSHNKCPDRRHNAVTYMYWVESTGSGEPCKVITRVVKGERESLCYATRKCNEMHNFTCVIDAFTSAATTSSTTTEDAMTTTPAAATTTRKATPVPTTDHELQHSTSASDESSSEASHASHPAVPLEPTDSSSSTEALGADKSSQNAGISKLGLAVGLPVGLVVVASIIVVLIIVVIRRKKRPAREQGPPMAVDNAVYNVESDHVITSVPKHGGDVAQNESKMSPAGPKDLSTHSQAQHLKSMDSHSPNLKSQSPTYANVAPSPHYENAAMDADATGAMHDDVIMMDNDVYNSADDREKAGDRSVYCLAKEIPQRQVHEKDSDEVVFEENDVCERSAGIGSADDVDGNIIFEENDMYERTL